MLENVRMVAVPRGNRASQPLNNAGLPGLDSLVLFIY